MKIWGKEWKDNRMLRDTVIVIDGDDTRTHKVLAALDLICAEFDLARPIWLDSCVRDFQRHARCRFTRDCFVEEIPFDYLEILVLEEDEPS